MTQVWLERVDNEKKKFAKYSKPHTDSNNLPDIFKTFCLSRWANRSWFYW